MCDRDPLATYYFDPNDVSNSLRLLGEHLREARLRRNMTVDQVAKMMKVHRTTIGDAEQGKPTTGIGVYVGILWALGIGEQVHDLATVEREYEELAEPSGRKRASPRPA